jgi:hypothetical protein
MCLHMHVYLRPVSRTHYDKTSDRPLRHTMAPRIFSKPILRLIPLHYLHPSIPGGLSLALILTNAKLMIPTCATLLLIWYCLRCWSKLRPMNGTNLEAPHYVLFCSFMFLSLYYFQIHCSAPPSYTRSPCCSLHDRPRVMSTHVWYTYNSLFLTR